MQDFRQLIIWQEAMGLACDTYLASKTFPEAEKYGLTSQIRRSSVSIPSNIAEGCGRGSQREFARFLRIAYGSACELETQVLLAGNLGILDEARSATMATRIDRLRSRINALVSKVEETT